jgi:osmotically-inducible protein OsmY
MNEPAATEPDEYLVAHIRDRLAAGPGAAADVAELGVAVSVHGGRVFLDGVVSSEEQRDAVVAAAREVAGGREVCADITVCEPSAAAPEERLR